MPSNGDGLSAHVITVTFLHGTSHCQVLILHHQVCFFTGYFLMLNQLEIELFFWWHKFRLLLYFSFLSCDIAAERISVRLGMRVYSRNVCAYVRVCHVQERQFAQLRSFALVHPQKFMTMEVEDREKWCLITMEDAENSAAGPPQHTCLQSRVLNAANSWQHWERESRKVNVQKTPRGQEENKRKWKKKPCCGESWQVRYKLCSHSTVVLVSSLARCGVRHHAHAYS